MMQKQLIKKIIRNLFIQTKITPNPNFLKFIPTGKTVMIDGTMDFTAPRFANQSPLALKLFLVEGVNRVFYGKDYISISKKDDSDWNYIKPQIFSHIMDHFTSDKELFNENPEPEDTKILVTDSEEIKNIKEIINTRIRPSVQEDGGDIQFNSFENGVVKILMKGACAGCPSSQITLKNGIEKMLVHYVKSVESEDYKQ